MESIQSIKKNIKYLRVLSDKYPTIQSVSSRIINLQANLDLPKGTEHYMSDLHGEWAAFLHILNNASGVIREKVDMVYANTMCQNERAELSTLIYYPERKLVEIKKVNQELTDWYRITLHRLIEICRLVASKYNREKVRGLLPDDFYNIIDELLHTNYDYQNKELYYGRIISTIIDIDRADEFICALAELIKRLAVDRLHIIGDIFDRGPRPDIIVDSLIEHHSVDIQWGNHDILWMGAAAGNPACIAIVLCNSIKYNNLEFIENGYGITLRQLAMFAQDTYGNVDCSRFAPKVTASKTYTPKDLHLASMMHKALAIIQFKLEGQIISRHPEYQMDARLLLDKVDYENKAIIIDGVRYDMEDCDFPTVDRKNPFVLSQAENDVIHVLRSAFLRSEKLQTHMQFLYASGGVYLCCNSNLLCHGCVPLDENGEFASMILGKHTIKGKELLDVCDELARQGYFAMEHSLEKQNGEDFLWYMWCGKNSPLFGRDKITTFERYFIKDKTLHKEAKNPYYTHSDRTEVIEKILCEFGLDPETSHIINGHEPVHAKDGENPIKAGGKLIVIDGGLCKAYQSTTGIAGYTLTFNSYGMRLISHEPFENTTKAIMENTDILSTSNIFETVRTRLKVSDTDDGKHMQEEIDDLKLLLSAYRLGYVKEAY